MEPFLEAIEAIGVKLRIVDNFTSTKKENFTHTQKWFAKSLIKFGKLSKMFLVENYLKTGFLWSPIDSKGSLDEQ